MKVGIVGAGSISKSAHLPAFKSIPSIEVARIADLNGQAAKKLSKEFNIANWGTDYKEIMNDDSIELVDVCTPVQVRLDVIKAAAERGKHVMVEKPLAISLKEAMEIYRTVKKNNVQLSVVQNYRYFPCVNKVKDRISKGYLGNIISIQSTGLTPHPAEGSKANWLYHFGGALYDFTPHLIDVLLLVNNSTVEKVTAFGGDFTGGNMGHINYAQILLEFKDRSLAVADISWLTAILGMRFTMNIHGSGGHIMMDIRNNNYLEFHGLLTPFDELSNSIKKTLEFSKNVITGAYFKGPLAYHRAFIENYVESLRTHTKPPVAIEHSVMVNAVLDAAKESLANNNKPIYLKDLFAGDDYSLVVVTKD